MRVTKFQSSRARSNDRAIAIRDSKRNREKKRERIKFEADQVTLG